MTIPTVRITTACKRRSCLITLRGDLMHMGMMPKVAHQLPFFVRAIARGRSPDKLERQKRNKKDEEISTHRQSVSAQRGQICFEKLGQALDAFASFSKRSPLPTTSKLAPISAKTAIHIVAVPNTAMTRNTDLIPKARVMFCHKMAWVRFDN